MAAQENSRPLQLPEAYQEVLYWRLSDHKRLLVILNVVGLLTMGVMLGAFTAWAQRWHPLQMGNFSALQLLAILAMAILTVVVHELLHGLALRCYGARPAYGVLWNGMMFYATAAGHAFPRNAYLVIALAPLVGLSLVALGVLALPLPGWLTFAVILCAAFNVGSAWGDLWLVRTALRYPRAAYIVDEKDGMRVFLPVEG